jgi:hypothetical protein
MPFEVSNLVNRMWACNHLRELIDICSEKDSELKLISNEIDELGRKYGRILGN